MRTKKGGAVRMPSEYFGNDSGRYTNNLNAGLCPNAYGDTNPVSFGTLNNGNTTGPNMAIHPDASGLQTGGAIRLPSEYYGQDSGRYSDTVPGLEKTAYGEQNAVSFSTINQDNTVGPNLAVSPNSSNLQTGGKRRRRRKSSGKGKKRTSLRKKRKNNGHPKRKSVKRSSSKKRKSGKKRSRSRK